MHRGEVLLLEAILSDLPGEVRGRLGGAREHHQPAHDAVEPMHGAHIRRRIAELPAHKLRYAARFVGGQHPRRFQADDDILIAVYDLHSGSS